MIFIIQAISILFAIMLAKHDAPATELFKNDGVSNKYLAIFHRYNVWIKFIFCAVASLVASPEWVTMFIYGLAAALWIYLVFDPALNLNRPGLRWWYLGLNDADGRFWQRIFGRKAGRIKAVILTVLIILLNLFYKQMISYVNTILDWFSSSGGG